ncbi:hypothetical protein WN48_10795 [Eufriesea mexicana]|uniref:Uncharacterized protein n=1 Tax=Eufriesea mexicana TaxID=516756 RepID=A0A310SGL1_9HYME|nr:hypothetical protein WN48_10795 [Eufriesea mexicana]
MENEKEGGAKVWEKTVEADRFQFTSSEVPLIPGGIRFPGSQPAKKTKKRYNEKPGVELNARKGSERIGTETH